MNSLWFQAATTLVLLPPGVEHGRYHLPSGVEHCRYSSGARLLAASLAQSRVQPLLARREYWSQRRAGAYLRLLRRRLGVLVPGTSINRSGPLFSSRRGRGAIIIVVIVDVPGLYK